jgi:hypothetical protein
MLKYNILNSIYTKGYVTSWVVSEKCYTVLQVKQCSEQFSITMPPDDGSILPKHVVRKD